MGGNLEKVHVTALRRAVRRRGGNVRFPCRRENGTASACAVAEGLETPSCLDVKIYDSYAVADVEEYPCRFAIANESAGSRRGGHPASAGEFQGAWRFRRRHACLRALARRRLWQAGTRAAAGAGGGEGSRTVKPAGTCLLSVRPASGMIGANEPAGRPRGRHGHEERPGSIGKRWWVTPTRGDPRESATESRPPSSEGKGETAV